MDDVSDWTVEAVSPGGTEGYWIRKEAGHGRRALLKIPKARKSFIEGEAISEAIASWVGQAMELPVQETRLVQYKGRTASLSWDFCVPNLELREGAVLMGITASRQRLTMHQVRSLLAAALGELLAQQQLINLIAFDMLIGNSDRHFRNWGILVPRTGLAPKMAPYYDHGSSLGAAEEPRKLREHLTRGWEHFDRGFRYEMTVEGTKRPRIPQVLDAVAIWDPTYSGFMTKLDKLTDDVIDQIIGQVPAEAEQAERCEFIRQLLRHRRDLLKEKMDERSR